MSLIITRGFGESETIAGAIDIAVAINEPAVELEVQANGVLSHTVTIPSCHVTVDIDEPDDDVDSDSIGVTVEVT